MSLNPKSTGCIKLMDKNQIVPQTIDITSGPSPKDIAEFQHHVPPDSGPEILEQIEMVVSQADALKNDTECEKLCNILIKYKDNLYVNSMDCGLTTIHRVRIPAPPGAPRTSVQNCEGIIQMIGRNN